jgi:O-antigen/teichoic acid export membrane protein
MFKLFKDSAISLSYKLISVFLKFLLIYIITNIYGAENYGAYVFAISIFLFLNTLFRFGFDIYIQKFTVELLNVNNKNKAQLKFLQTASISVFTILIITLLIKFYFIFIPEKQLLKSLYFSELIIYGSVYAFYWMTIYYFRGMGKGKTSVFVMEIVQPLVNIFILLIFINFFENLLLPSEKIIHSFGLSIIICLTIFTVLEKFNFLAFYNKSSFFKKTILLEINNSKAFLFISASGMLLAWVDTYIISFL